METIYSFFLAQKFFNKCWIFIYSFLFSCAMLVIQKHFLLWHFCCFSSAFYFIIWDTHPTNDPTVHSNKNLRMLSLWLFYN